jgi:uncharacterized protein involved in copper resistance
MRPHLTHPALAASLLVVSGAVVVAGGSASAATPLTAVTTPTTVHGTGFQAHSMLDTSFCIDVAPGATEGRPVALSQCTAAASQRWGFTWNTDRTNLLVESEGMCLDGRRPKAGVAATVGYCRSADPWHYVFTAEGLIQNVRTGQCLTVPRAASGAAVYFDVCDVTRTAQLWKLSA